ncbi:MAG: helix-turn-helix domain-containing protein [Acidimicrobiales bacterium]|nr:helix-turn-helix domain-containing protein [Acidimicrobiales bacterium]
MDGAPLTPAEFGAAVTAITNAFGDPTRRDIYLYAREEADGVTAAGAAERFDLHPNVARHHLDKLASGGYLEVAVERPEGATAGRPSKHYRVSDPGQPLELPVRQDTVLIGLLGRTLALLPSDQAEAMAEEVGAEVGRSMAESIGADEVHRSFKSAMHAVADALTAHGFAARAERTGGDQLRIVSEHCPFGGAPIEHPVICAVDRGLVRGMLGALYGDAETDLSSSLPMGDSVCITEVTV